MLPIAFPPQTVNNTIESGTVVWVCMRNEQLLVHVGEGLFELVACVHSVRTCSNVLSFVCYRSSSCGVNVRVYDGA